MIFFIKLNLFFSWILEDLSYGEGFFKDWCRGDMDVQENHHQEFILIYRLLKLGIGLYRLYHNNTQIDKKCEID